MFTRNYRLAYDRSAYSTFYYPRPKNLREHGKYFLMDDSFERCGTIGFRCVADVGPPSG